MRPNAAGPGVLLLTGLLLAAGASPVRAQSPTGGFEVVEASILDLQEALATGRVTSVQLVEAYLARIAAYDRQGPILNAIIRLNPEARADATALDAERAEGRVRGPLHGIPIVLKDNYDTRGLPTTGASIVLAGSVPADDGFQVRKLREAGAIILAKTNLHELAAGITTVSSLGGQTRNPYDPSRNPGGSSGGTGAAVASSFAAVGWGSDTCGSIRIPAAVHNLVGLRPTKGLSSIAGILPLSHTQDTGGPLARTVRDLAIALDATVGPDPNDPATQAAVGRDLKGFVPSLDPGALEGVRIGALEEWLNEGFAEGGTTRVVREALGRMESAGADVVDVTIPSLDSLVAGTGLIDYEFKFDLMDYLAELPDPPVDSLGEILGLGLHHRELDAQFRRRNAVESRDSDEYREARGRREQLRTTVVDFMDEHGLDALAYPTMMREPALIGDFPEGATCFLSAHTGLPAITMPAGFTENELPVGLELLGRSFDDARLVAMAFALEAAGSSRRPPSRTPPLREGRVPEPRRFVASGSAGGVALNASFSLDLPGGALGYLIVVQGVPASEVHATVLRRVGTDAAEFVVARLSGPGEGSGEGTLELTPRLLQDLLGDRLELSLHTAARPRGAVQVRVRVAGR